MIKHRLLFLVLGLIAAGMPEARAQNEASTPRNAVIEIRPTVTLLAFPGASHDREPALETNTQDRSNGEFGTVVALPFNARAATIELTAGETGAVRISNQLMRMRGQPVAMLRISDPPEGPFTVAVRHDGDWHAKADARLVSPALHAGLPGLPGPALSDTKQASRANGGSYVIISAPQYELAAAPLAEWKRRKGWPVVTVTTDETGVGTADIHAWLQQAYDQWSRPPEYVLLVGDADDIPTFYIDGNVSDHPYTLLDGDDWLPDLMLGRFAVSNQSDCEVMVAKTVHYESQPYVDQDHWFTRGVMIGGQYGSVTPMHTVRFCGEQLQSLGFEPLVPVTPLQLEGNYIVSPYIAAEQIGVPNNMGPLVINPAIETGCSLVVYRGWAYGTGGWFSPTYQVANIETLQNGAMLPVVMSFVCHTGNFDASVPCMGEAFTRLGGSDPADFNGAVAFYGTGEPWSNTRFNDAMAISHFERITDPALSTLGSLIVAGKLRFMEFYPGSVEESSGWSAAEFYFHIYNLLGDPELNYHRARPTALSVVHPEDLPVGATMVDCTVAENPGGNPVTAARIGIAQNGLLLGTALTDEFGTARIVLTTPAQDGPVHLTVTHPGRLAYSAALNTGDDGAHLALDEFTLTDLQGQPAVVRPGAEISLLPVLRNLGSTASGEAVLELTADGPVQISTSGSVLAPLAAGASSSPDAPFILHVAADAPCGAVLSGRLSARHGIQDDLSGFELRVHAPEIAATAASSEGAGWVEPGTTTDLLLTVANEGSLATTGGLLAFSLTGHEGAALLTESLPFGALGIGDVMELGPITLQVDQEVAGGTTLNIRITAQYDEGSQQITSIAVAVGSGDVAESSGPDNYGYYAYDSADHLYPDQRPVYRWLEISSALGGPGTRLPLNNNNLDRRVVVELPFTFRFYGVDYDSVRVSDNGWLSFDADNDFFNFYNWPIPVAHGNGALVAPFWDNLTPEPHPNPEADPVGMNSDGVYWYHDEQAGEVLFEWSRMRHIYDEITEMQTFQAVLRDPAVHASTPTGDGEILFFYKQVADNDHLRMYATVGIESPDESDGLQLTYDGVRARGFAPLGPGMAVRLTTAPPIRVPLSVTAQAARRPDGVVHLAWTLTDERPVLGWRIHASRPHGRLCLTPEMLAADTRQHTLVADAASELVLEAVLPFGGTCEAARIEIATFDLRFSLADPTPNPIRGTADLAFSLPRDGNVQMRIYDVRGRHVSTLINDRLDSGHHAVVWEGRDDDGRQLADGIYFLRLETAGKVLTRKLLLVR
jgi:hypothetical protein